MAFEFHRLLPQAGRRDRPIVLWIGTVDPNATSAFEQFGLRIESVPPTIPDLVLSESRAAIVDLASNGDRWLGARRRFFDQFLINGLLLVPHISSLSDEQRWRALLPAGGDISDRIWPWNSSTSAIATAEYVSRWMPGPPSNDKLDIKMVQLARDSGPSLDMESEILLRRAFSDATSVTLRPLAGGYSAQTFRVDAFLNQPGPAARPLPFVVKFDTKQKISTEFKNYWAHVHTAVPFHLRPIVDPSRCLIGRNRGVLVATFINGGEPLDSAARRGHAQLAMYSLYDHAMATWIRSGQTAKESLVKVLQRCLGLPRHFSTSPRGIAWQAKGLTVAPIQLGRSLLAKSPEEYLHGVTHGDLHARNVHVRGNDAILLDFYGANLKRPALFDSAYLEVTTSFSTDCHKELKGEWRPTIERLYRLSALEDVPAPELDPISSKWLRNFVRQVRLFAIPMQKAKTEYATIMAWALLRHATFAPNRDAHEKERMVAYKVAEKLIKAITK